MNLGTIVTAMITPFDKRGLLDIAEAQRLARWLVDRNTDGLVLAGSTGEGQSLDKNERNALWAAIKGASASSPAWPKGVWPRSWASASASARSSLRPSARAVERAICATSRLWVRRVR